jgi:hypothetical protein
MYGPFDVEDLKPLGGFLIAAPLLIELSAALWPAGLAAWFRAAQGAVFLPALGVTFLGMGQLASADPKPDVGPENLRTALLSGALTAVAVVVAWVIQRPFLAVGATIIYGLVVWLLARSFNHRPKEPASPPRGD